MATDYEIVCVDTGAVVDVATGQHAAVRRATGLSNQLQDGKHRLHTIRPIETLGDEKCAWGDLCTEEEVLVDGTIGHFWDQHLLGVDARSEA